MEETIMLTASAEMAYYVWAERVATPMESIGDVLDLLEVMEFWETHVLWN